MKIVQILSVMLLIFALCSCGDKTNSNDTKDTKDSTTTQNEIGPEDKKTDLTGEWVLVSIDTAQQEEGTMLLSFDKESHIVMTFPGETKKGTYKKSADGKSLTIKTDDISEDTWEIKSINETELIVIDTDPKDPSLKREYAFKR